MQWLIGAAVGLACGVISGFGIGGGSLLMIWLTAVVGVEQRTAQGINLLFFLPTALTALVLHCKNRFIRWQTVIPAALAGSVAAGLSAWLTGQLEARFLRTIFGIFLLFIGLKELFGKQSRRSDSMRKENPVKTIVDLPPSPTDPDGSYTGKPMKPDEIPVQDADDL